MTVISRIALCFVVALLFAIPSYGCGEEYLLGSRSSGHSHRHILAETSTHWNYNRNGDDWPEVCETGKQQSPIAINLGGSTPASAKGVSLKFGVASGAKVINTGHSIQVEWTSLKGNTARIPSRGMWGTANDATVALQPFQFHFHSTCEHIVDGFMCPIELHLVTRVDKNAADSPKKCKDPKTNCLAVFGVMQAFTADPMSSKNVSALANAIAKSIPKGVGAENAVDLPLASVDLGALLPADKKFAWYSGSLTAPPCSEEVSWHVFSTPLEQLSIPYLAKLQQAMATTLVSEEARATKGSEAGSRTNNRIPQPLNGRKVEYYDA